MNMDKRIFANVTYLTYSIVVLSILSTLIWIAWIGDFHWPLLLLISVLLAHGIVIYQGRAQSNRQLEALKTELKSKMEDAVRMTEMRMAQAANIARLGIWEWDASTDVTTWNPQMFKIYGIKPEEFTGKGSDYIKFTRKDYLDVQMRNIEKAFTEGMTEKEFASGVQGRSDPKELCIVRPDGTECYTLGEAVCIVDENRKLLRMLGVTLDITAFKKAEEVAANEKQKAMEAVQRADRLDSLGILAGGIAHDFNNLLSGLFGHMELALEASTEGKPRAHLNSAMGVFDRARDLTQQLLTFAKGGQPIRKTGDIGALIRGSTKFALSGSKVTCHFAIPTDLPLCDFDANQMGQVIDNLVINAVQAMPNGGALHVTSECVILEESRLVGLCAGRYVKTTFRDEGVGISESALKRIFDPFFTTKTEGSGLGLAAAYSILQKHQGAIQVQSLEGEGSAFTLYLPASDQTQMITEVLSSASHQGQGAVLIMDDEDFNRDIVTSMVQGMGYSVLAAADGQEAIQVFTESLVKGKKVDWVLLDLTIPGGMGGQETAKVLRNLSPDLKICATSGYADDPVMAVPREFGFDGSIRKPFRKAELSELMNQLHS
jgi:PAS domain S-box-containing protein